MGESVGTAPLQDYESSRFVSQNVALAYQVLSPAPREAWRELYRRDPEALPSQSPEWLDCICAFGGYKDASRLYTLPDGQQLLLPNVARKALPERLSVQASLPYAWGMGGVLTKRELRPEDLAVVFDDLTKRNVMSISLVPNPRQGSLWQAAQPEGIMGIPRRAHVLDLKGGFDKVWSERFTKQTRKQVRKAEKSGVVVECDTTGRLVPVFEALFQRSVDRWAEQQNEPRWLAHLRASQRDPFEKTRHIARSMGEACRVWVAWHEGVPVAASMVLVGANVDGLRSVSDKTLAAPLNANDLLKKLAIEDACRAGCRYYHLGESGESAGIAAFKERLGARPYPYTEYRLERLPLSRLDRGLRGVVKRAIGFKDV